MPIVTVIDLINRLCTLPGNSIVQIARDSDFSQVQNLELVINNPDRTTVHGIGRVVLVAKRPPNFYIMEDENSNIE